jgi:hypothetical protein
MTVTNYMSYFMDTFTLLDLANIDPSKSGLKYYIRLYGRRKTVTQYGPRIKVSNVQRRFDLINNFILTIENEPQVIGNCKIPKEHLDHVKDWIKLNHDHLHSMWHNYETQDTQDELSKLTKL